MYEPTKQFPTIPENCCWYLLCGFMALRMYLFWKFTMPFLVTPASSVKSCYRWDLHIVKGTPRKVFGVDIDQVDLMSLYSLQMVWVQQLSMQNPRYCHACCMFDCLYSMKTGTGTFLIYFTMSLSSTVYHSRANSTGHRDVMTNGIKYTWVFKTTLRICLCVQT
jgi:hypothetical protein